MSHILAVSYGGGHSAMLAPIIKELQKRGHKVTTLGLTTAYAYYRQRGIDCIGYKDLLDPANHEAIAYGEKLAKNTPANSAVSYAETVAYLGLNYQDLINRLGEDRAKDTYASQNRKAFLPVGLMEELIKNTCPDVVLATNSPRTEEAVLHAAQNLDVPSVCVVDLNTPPIIDQISSPHYATVICVPDENARQAIIDAGGIASSIHVTGNPVFDNLFKSSTIAAGQKLRDARGWDASKINLLWASTPEPAHHEKVSQKGDPALPLKVERALRDFIADHDSFRLIVRFHPNENSHFIPQPRVYLSPREENIHELLHAVDGVVVTVTTVGLEAYHIGKTVISIDCSILASLLPYSKMGVSYGVQKLEDIAETLLFLKKEGYLAHKPISVQKTSAVDIITSLIINLRAAENTSA